MKNIKGEIRMKNIKGEIRMKNTVTAALKKMIRAEMKKVMTAIIVFGMVISPAVNAIAEPIGDKDGENKEQGGEGEGGSEATGGVPAVAGQAAAADRQQATSGTTGGDEHRAGSASVDGTGEAQSGDADRGHVAEAGTVATGGAAN
ncbi:hypothetical protein AGMMS49936_11390 [Endomicrobiia bacterium]|nr:hypothetical protein AGMMS49936_11390 [Endomicrobiia bacterium]